MTAAHLHAVDSAPLTDLQQAIRAALAHERAAGSHEDKYEQQMRSAGASMYAAFTAALRACEEYRGRQITERAILRIYQSPKPRPWWDQELAAAGVKKDDGRADRERAARLIQWHVDPDGARARRAKHVLASASARKKLTDQRSAAARGSRAPREVSRREADAVRGAARGVEVEIDPGNAAVQEAGRKQVLALLGRLQSKAKRVDLSALADAVDVLEAVERDFDEALA
jgi:hypothetical protein